LALANRDKYQSDTWHWLTETNVGLTLGTGQQRQMSVRYLTLANRDKCQSDTWHWPTETNISPTLDTGQQRQMSV